MVKPPSRTVGVRDLTVSYDGRLALRRVNLDAHRGDILGVAGPNGSGKSTLIKSLIGLSGMSTGAIELAGTDWDATQRVPRRALLATGYVPQRSAVDLTFPIVVRQVVETGLLAAGFPSLWRRRQDRERVDRALDLMGLHPLADRHISQLSGGQLQRAFLARALVVPKTVLLLDEPLTGVDSTTAELIWKEISRTAESGGTVIVVHHDLEDLRDRATRVLLLSTGVVADDTPEVALSRPMLELAYGPWSMSDPGGSPVQQAQRPLDIGC
jgi:ABC-type Mn2+/Zn2+ transport system ATPase subunit